MWQSAYGVETTVNWFERHPNWTSGIFGHLLVFILFLLYVIPYGAWGRHLVNNLANQVATFRTPEFAFYYSLFAVIYFLLILALYLGMNIWYLRVKKLSFKYLGWLGLILVPSCISLLYQITNIDSLFPTPQIKFVFLITLDLMFPIAIILSAIVMLRLKGKKTPIAGE